MDITKTREPLVARNADLTGSCFGDVMMRTTAFSDMNLEGSRCETGMMPQTVFQVVSLAGARFEDVNLSGAAITDANMSGVSISCANYAGMRIEGIEVIALLDAYRKQNP